MIKFFKTLYYGWHLSEIEYDMLVISEIKLAGCSNIEDSNEYKSLERRKQEILKKMENL